MAIAGLTFLFLLTLSMVPSASAEAPDLINIEAIVGASNDDGDELVNDLVFIAHQEDREISGLEIRIYLNDIEIDSAITDDEGGAGFANLTDGNYSWRAFQLDQQLTYEGGNCIVNFAGDRGTSTYLMDIDDDGAHDDLFLMIPNGTGEGQPEGYYEIYNETSDLVASGHTNLSAEPFGNISIVLDLVPANYTFYLWTNESGTLLQNGSFNTHPAPVDSNEWFADWFYEYEDRDSDGRDDWVMVHYDVDTGDPQMTVNVTWVIENSTGVELVNVTDPFTAPNGTVDHRNLSWLCSAGDDYTFRLHLFDENNTLEDSNSSLATLDLYSLPPLVNFSSPQPDTMVWGVVNLTGNASDPDGDSTLELVEVRYQGGDWANATPLGGDWTLWYHHWDTGSLPEGLYDLEARAYDGDNHSLVARMSLEVNHNDPPAVTVDSPQEGAQVRGNITIRGHAMDPDGAANLSAIQVSLDDIGFDQPWFVPGASSWNLKWNTSHASNGDHTLYFRALDHGGLHSPVVQVNFTILANQAPSIEVQSPEMLVKPQDWLVDIAWEAQDPEGDDMTVKLSVEPVGEPEERVTIATGLPASGTHTWNCSGFEVGIYRIWGRVTDSFGDHDSDSPSGRVDVPKVVVYFLNPAPAGDIADELYRVRWVVDGYDGSRTTDVFLDNDTDAENEGAVTLVNLQKQTSFDWDTSQLAEGTYYLRLNVTVDVLFLVSVFSGPLEVIHQDQPQQLANLTISPIELKEGTSVEFSIEVINPGSGSQRMNITYVMDSVLLAQKDLFVDKKDMQRDYLYWTATPGEHTLQVRVYRWHHDGFDQELELTFIVEGTAKPASTDEDNSPWPMILIIALTLVILVGALLVTRVIPVDELLEGRAYGGRGPPPSTRSLSRPGTPRSPDLPPHAAPSSPSPSSPSSPTEPSSPSSPPPDESDVDFGEDTDAPDPDAGKEDGEIEFEDEASPDVEFEDDLEKKTGTGEGPETGADEGSDTAAPADAPEPDTGKDDGGSGEKANGPGKDRVDGAEAGQDGDAGPSERD